MYCMRCRYNLRSSQQARTCPQCGEPFDLNDPATFFDSEWISVRRVRRITGLAAFVVHAIIVALLIGGATIIPFKIHGPHLLIMLLCGIDLPSSLLSIGVLDELNSDSSIVDGIIFASLGGAQWSLIAYWIAAWCTRMPVRKESASVK